MGEPKEKTTMELVQEALNKTVEAYGEEPVIEILHVITKLNEAIFWMNMADRAIEILHKQKEETGNGKKS